MGLATALGFVEKGWRVVGYDIQPTIRHALRSGRSPFHEPGFPALVRTHVRTGRFLIVDSVGEVAEMASGTFLCLPTPQRPNGRIDLDAILSGSRALGRALREVSGFRVVIVKSTVVPGTTTDIIEPILRETSGRNSSALGVGVNPEFLAEGSAVRDASKPERIVIGTSDRRTARWLRRVYAPFSAPICELPPAGAELAKYAANSFLAMKVSFANEMSRLSEKLGTNIDDIMAAVGKDSRIGEKFLRAGPGFGGSCFEKDIRALVARGKELGVSLRLGEATLKANDDQADHVVDLVRGAIGALRGKRIAFLGVSFKAGTDDVRESRAFPIISALVREGAEVRIHDPVALENFRREWKRLKSAQSDKVKTFDSVQEALNRPDAIVIHTDWPIFRRASRSVIFSSGSPIVDTRRLLRGAQGRRMTSQLVSLGLGKPRAAEDYHEGPRVLE